MISRGVCVRHHSHRSRRSPSRQARIQGRDMLQDRRIQHQDHIKVGMLPSCPSRHGRRHRHAQSLLQLSTILQKGLPAKLQVPFSFQVSTFDFTPSLLNLFKLFLLVIRNSVD